MQESERHEEQSAFHSALEVLKNAHGGDEALYEQLSRSWQRLKTAAWRGGAAGLTLRGGLNVLSTLLFMLRMATRGKGKARPKRGLTLPEAVNDTLRYTAFLAALGGSYVFVDEGLAILLGKSRTAKWRALVAGAVAGHTLLLTGRNQRHHSLATYILLRGLTLLVRTGNKPDCQQRHPVLHALLAPTRMAHGDTALMCLASSQIIYSFIVMPATLPPSYARFIDKIAGKESFVWHGAREQAWRNIRKEPLGPLKALQATPFKHCTSAVPCEFWHPGQTCTGHAVGILPHAYARALGIYLPVYLVPALLVHRQKLLKKPLVLLPKVATGVGRSALFLATYIALTFGGVCAGFTIFGASSGMSIATCVWIAGFATLLEKKSRRMELALYCLSRAAESYARCLVAWGVISRKSVPSRFDVVLFAAGCAAITHCYSDDRGRHRDVFRSKYLNVLDFIFGNTGVDLGAIKHLPSNRDMVAKVSHTIRSFSAQRLSAMAGQERVACNSQHTPLSARASAPAAATSGSLTSAKGPPCPTQDTLKPANFTHSSAAAPAAAADLPLEGTTTVRGVAVQKDSSQSSPAAAATAAAAAAAHAAAQSLPDTAAASETAGGSAAVDVGAQAVKLCPGAVDALAAQAAAATAAANMEAHAWNRRRWAATHNQGSPEGAAAHWNGSCSHADVVEQEGLDGPSSQSTQQQQQQQQRQQQDADVEEQKGQDSPWQSTQQQQQGQQLGQHAPSSSRKLQQDTDIVEHEGQEGPSWQSTQQQQQQHTHSSTSTMQGQHAHSSRDGMQGVDGRWQSTQQQQQQQLGKASCSSFNRDEIVGVSNGQVNDGHDHLAPDPLSLGTCSASGQQDGLGTSCNSAEQGCGEEGGQQASESAAAAGDDAAGGRAAESDGEGEALKTEQTGDGQAGGDGSLRVHGGGGVSKKAAKRVRKKGGRK